MALFAHDDPDLRRAVEPVPADVPAELVQHVPAGRGETDRVRPLAPVVNPTDAVAGSPRSSLSQVPATSSKAIAGGESATLNAFCSQPEAITSATSAASSDPPITKPKYRGPEEP